jgi:hypothetical protein
MNIYLIASKSFRELAAFYDISSSKDNEVMEMLSVTDPIE